MTIPAPALPLRGEWLFHGCHPVDADLPKRRKHDTGLTDETQLRPRPTGPGARSHEDAKLPRESVAQQMQISLISHCTVLTPHP